MKISRQSVWRAPENNIADLSAIQLKSNSYTFPETDDQYSPSIAKLSKNSEKVKKDIPALYP
ncbi:MAG: hypothetical protein GF350_11860 [Chitinivibrionales bacterium]|nr:hypothetical protein [Chitinivibrionales bacterium]